MRVPDLPELFWNLPRYVFGEGRGWLFGVVLIVWRVGVVAGGVVVIFLQVTAFLRL